VPDISGWTGPARHLAARVVAFMDASLAGAPTEPFEELALDLHRHQAAACPVIASLVERPPTGLHDLPAVPVDLFKTLPVGTVDPDEAGATFRTSGTTGGGRGVHRLRSTALYDHGAVSWARACVGALPPRSVNLLLDPARHPDSSLSHMVARLAPDATWHLGPDGLDVAGFGRALAAGGPAFVGATAFALAELLEEHAPPPLPPGSILMVTGGFKGRTHRLDGATLLERARARLRPDHLATEYGMTELSSQLWGTPDTPYRPPPWLRVLAMDPVTAAPCPPGTPGQLRLVDLANLDSAVAIETLDQGTVHPDGTLTLHGRLADAPARGCSLTVEEVWAARGR
jgi:hypothetical protein